MLEILAHLRYPIEKFHLFLARFREQVYKHFILSISKNDMKVKQNLHGGRCMIKMFKGGGGGWWVDGNG